MYKLQTTQTKFFLCFTKNIQNILQKITTTTSCYQISQGKNFSTNWFGTREISLKINLVKFCGLFHLPGENVFL